MEDEKIIKDLDSLWFFSNILSSPTLPSSFTLSVSLEEEEEDYSTSESPKSDQQNPRFPEQLQSTSTDFSEVETCSDFDSSSFESETESEIQEMESFTIKAPVMEEKIEERSRANVTESQDLRDFGFDFGLECLLVVPMIPKLPESGNPYLICKMPSLSDGMAMKKHLKLWAHAVACTVK